MSATFDPNAVHDIVIAGSGPAGLTAALYAARANLNPIVFEGFDQPGGQLTTTTEVENFPGFPEGVTGPELVEKMKAQAERFGTVVVGKTVVDADLSQRPFRLTIRTRADSDDAMEVRCRTLVISTGASAKYIGIPSEQALMNRGVSACAVCDGALPAFRNRPLAVVGGGDSAMEEANYLTRFASKVFVIHRRRELRASKIMQDRAMANPKIEFVWDSVVEEVLDVSLGKVTGVKLKNLKTGELSTLEVSGLFAAIGHTPNTAFLRGQVKTDAQGFVVVEEPSTRTSVPGVFACGDVMDPHYKQAITAAGTGCRAALDAEKFLEAEGR